MYYNYCYIFILFSWLLHCKISGNWCGFVAIEYSSEFNKMFLFKVTKVTYYLIIILRTITYELFYNFMDQKIEKFYEFIPVTSFKHIG